MQPEIVADTLASATEEMMWNSALLSQYRVIRRNGQVTPFDGHKIAAAMTKAFLAVEGDTAKNSTRIQNAVATHTRQVINNISRRLTERGMVHIEDIQDQVELALMRAGEHKVARAYVLYREQHAQRRAQQPNKPQMHITKTSGELVTLDQDRLRAVVSEACLGLAYVDANLIVEDCLKNLFDGIPEADVNRALVMSSRTLVEKEPNYSYVTARLLLDHLRQEALNFLDFPAKTATAAEMSSYYARYLPLYLEAGIKHELLNPKLREYDLGILGAALKPERDFQFTYLGLQTLYDRYFLHWDEVRFELPQAFFMRVAMGLALNEDNKEQRAIEFYNLLSSFDFMSSTPTLFNSGSLRSQLSSCFLTTVPDDLEGIYGAIKDNAMLQKWAGGIGNDWSNVRGMGSLIKGTNGKSQGVVPFLKVANDTLVAVNQCFAPDTLIFTADGIKPIKEVKRGDLVLGQRGAYREVQENFAYLHQRDDMVELTVKHAITPLQVSAGHPFFVIKDVPMNQSIARTKAQLASGKRRTEWADVGTLKKGDYVAQVIPHEIVPVADFTEEDARLYGILLGDGHCSRRKQEWGVSGNPSCDTHLAFVRDYLTARGIHFWEAKGNAHFTQIRWSYSAAVERCGTTGRFVGAGEAVLPFGRDDLYTAQGEKYIARRFAHLPPAQTLALLQGLLETDGGISRGKEIYFTSSSLPLVEGIRYQCLRMGIATAGQKRLRDTTHDATRIDGTALHFKGESLSYDIRIPAVPALASRLGCQALTKYNWFIHNNHLFSRVRACEPIQPIPVIHDLKVEGDESYMTTAALAHNGGRRRGSGCAYLESWHIDIEEFLELRKNTGDERRRTHDMNTANWIPDLFMQRVHENGSWTLFSPNETPDLHDLYGEAFRTAYESYEQLAETGKIRVWKRVAAVELWRKMLSMLFETGHPWITFKDVCNLRSPQQHVGVVHSSNLCCIAADQRVVTDRGLLTIGELYELGGKNQVVGLDGVYKASEMLLPRPNAPMVQIETREGYTHKVTPDHKVWVKDKGWVEAQHLELGDKLLTQQLEGLWGKKHNPELGYVMGLIAGDGTFSKEKSQVHIDVWAQDFCYLEPIQQAVHCLLEGNTVLRTTSTNRPEFAINDKLHRARLSSAPLFRLLNQNGFTPENKLEVPAFVWQSDRETVAAYLRGIYQADGNVVSGGEVTTLALASTSLKLIQELQILWANFGVKSSINQMRDHELNPMPDGKGGKKEYWSKPLYRLLITSIKGCQIAESITQLASNKTSAAAKQYLDNLQKEGYSQKLYATFTSLTELPNEDAYCLMVESETHAWTVNGLITKNTEITLNTKAYPDPIKNQQEGEIAVCNLASINLANHIQDGKLDIEKLQRTIRTGMRMLDNVVELNYYAVPQSRNANLQHRPVGMGIMGFQDALYQLQIPYASQAAVDFADQSMEVVSYYAIHASTELAAERGRYKSFEGSLWSKGVLPVDSIQFVVKSRPSQYLEIDTRSTLDWDSLRQRVTQIGMRNSNCMAIAPTACVIADTLVAGKNGLLQMDEIGDVTGETWQAIELIVNQQSANSAASKFYCNGVRAVRTVTTANGHAVTGTDNHRLKVLSSENKLEWKFLKDIALDDLVAHRLGGYEATEIQSIRTLGEQGINAKETNLPHCLDEDMAVFLGAYMANGYVKYKLDGTPEAVKISLNTNRLEFLEMLRNLGKSWGVYSADEESQGVTTLCFYSVELGRLFVEENWSKPRGNKGEGAAGAFIPRKIRMSPKVIIAKFLQGLFTDGSLTFQERGSPVVEMSTVSEKLASQLHTLLWALGYMTTRLKSQSGSLGLREVHRVRIANVNHTLKFLRAVGWHTQEFLSKALSYEGSAQDGSRGLRVSGHSLIAEIQALDGLSQETKNFLATAKHQGHLSFNALEEIATENECVKNTLAWQLMVEGILLLPVVSNEQQQKVVPTFDIEVPNKHEYVANSMVNHNTISNIVGVSQSIEPTYQNLFVKSNLSGEFTVINPYLINELRQRGLWDEAMVNDLKYFDGSLRYIERIPQDLQDLYATAFEIDPAWLIEAAARRQKWIDQSQSLNLYMLEPSGRKLDSLYKLAWLRGLKTTYYLRSMGATHVEKSTIRDRKLNAVSNEPAPQVCSIDNPDCESCQ